MTSRLRSISVIRLQFHIFLKLRGVFLSLSKLYSALKISLSHSISAAECNPGLRTYWGNKQVRLKLIHYLSILPIKNETQKKNQTIKITREIVSPRGRALIFPRGLSTRPSPWDASRIHPVGSDKRRACCTPSNSDRRLPNFSNKTVSSRDLYSSSQGWGLQSLCTPCPSQELPNVHILNVSQDIPKRRQRPHAQGQRGNSSVLSALEFME